MPGHCTEVQSWQDLEKNRLISGVTKPSPMPNQLEMATTKTAEKWAGSLESLEGEWGEGPQKEPSRWKVETTLGTAFYFSEPSLWAPLLVVSQYSLFYFKP